MRDMLWKPAPVSGAPHAGYALRTRPRGRGLGALGGYPAIEERIRDKGVVVGDVQDEIG
jgi:hypothetical protein